MQDGRACCRLVATAVRQCTRHVRELLAQVAPFPHAQERQEVFAAPVAQHAVAAGRGFAGRAPEIEHPDEVRALVREQRMLGIGGFRLVGRSFTRVLDAQERDDRERFVHAARASGLDQDSRQSRVDRQRGHLAPEARDPSIPIHGAEFLQQAVTVVEQARVRRVEERKVLRASERERGHLQDEAGQVGPQQFRFRIAGPRDEVVLGIQPDADALALAPATAAALIGARLRHGLDRQALELRARTVAADACESGIDDEPHAGNRQRRLGDVGREHDAPARVPGKHLVLVRTGEASVQRQHVPIHAAAHEQVARLQDLLLTRQEHECVATQSARVPLQFLERIAHGLGQRRSSLVLLRERSIPHLDRIALPLDVDDGCATEEFRETLRLDRR